MPDANDKPAQPLSPFFAVHAAFRNLWRLAPVPLGLMCLPLHRWVVSMVPQGDIDMLLAVSAGTFILGFACIVGGAWWFARAVSRDIERAVSTPEQPPRRG